MVARNRLYPKIMPEDAEKIEQAVVRAIQPDDKIEQMHCEDIGHGHRRAQQLRKWEDALIKMNMPEALFKLLRRLALEPRKIDYLVQNYSHGGLKGKAEVDAILARVGLDQSAIEVEAFLICLSNIMALDRLQESQAVRRDRSLAGLRFYREMKRRQPRAGRGKHPEGGQGKCVSLIPPRADNDK